MVDEVNPLVEELGVSDISHIGLQNYESAKAENARVEAIVAPEQTNPRYLMSETPLSSATEFDQKPEEKAKAEAYLAAIQETERNVSAFDAENAKAKADQLARAAAQQALSEPPSA